MADDIRQKIIDEVSTRLATITTGNGYETNIGNSVTVWRDEASAPFPDNALDMANIKDLHTEHDGDGQRLGTTQVELQLEVQVATINNSMARDKRIRKMFADIIKAIGTDRKWNNGTDNLAWDTRIDSTDMDVQQKGEVVGGGRILFTIFYRTPDFDPYTENH